MNAVTSQSTAFSSAVGILCNLGYVPIGAANSGSASLFAANVDNTYFGTAKTTVASADLVNIVGCQACSSVSGGLTGIDQCAATAVTPAATYTTYATISAVHC